MDEMLRKKEIELETIGLEKEKKDFNSAAMLKKALERGDVLAD